MNRARHIAELLQGERVETVTELREWLSRAGSRDKLLAVNGLGLRPPTTSESSRASKTPPPSIRSPHGCPRLSIYGKPSPQKDRILISSGRPSLRATISPVSRGRGRSGCALSGHSVPPRTTTLGHSTGPLGIPGARNRDALGLEPRTCWFGPLLASDLAPLFLRLRCGDHVECHRARIPCPRGTDVDWPSPVLVREGVAGTRPGDASGAPLRRARRTLHVCGRGHEVRMLVALRRLSVAPVPGATDGVETASSKGIHAAPASRDVEHFETTDYRREHRVDHEVIPDWLQPEHRRQ